MVRLYMVVSFFFDYSTILTYLCKVSSSELLLFLGSSILKRCECSGNYYANSPE